MNFTLYYIHDPMCSWCYAFKPILDKLIQNLSNDIKFVYVVGGLAGHSDVPMSENQKEMIQNTWYEIERKTGTKFNHNFWKNNIPRRSTYLSCQATMLARYEKKEVKMIEAIQEAYYLKALNPSDSSILINLAIQIGLDKNKFEENLKSEKIEKDLSKELDFRRSLNVRGFPSLVLKDEKDTYNINIDFENYKVMNNQIKNLIK